MKSIRIIPGNKAVKINTAVPSSKSYTNRALILAALAEGKSTIINPLESDDTKYMLSALKNLGIKTSRQKNKLIIQGTAGTFNKSPKQLFLGNAGTAVRFLTAALATQDFKSTLTGNERMKERPIADLIDALRGWGAEISSQKNSGCPPLKIKGPLKGGPTKVNGTISSQYLSALLMAAPYAQNKAAIKVTGKLTSLPYVKMTLDTIKKFGGKIKNEKFKTYTCNPHHFKATEYEVEGDASSASYPWALAAATGGITTITNIPADSKQADLEFLKVLKKMGCEVTNGINVQGPKRLKSLGTIDLNHMPDAAMTVAILCTLAKGKSILTGLGNLRVKETDRLAALKTELQKSGAKVKTGKDRIEIEGNPSKLHGAVIETYDDHRMAMCFAVLGAKVPGITVKNPDCVSKTYPGFFKDLKKWGIKVI